MIFDADQFVFKPPPPISRARRVLIKPCASSPEPYPVSTSRDILATIIKGIRQVSDADILLLEGTQDGSPIHPVFQALGYNFPRVLTLDVKNSIMVEVDNPLPKPLTVPTFWIPNVILSSDYLISVVPFKVSHNSGHLSIMNLLTLLSSAKYGEGGKAWGSLYALGMEKVIADLYFTLPFDLGIIEARQILIEKDGPGKNEVKDFGKIFAGEPYEVDREASEAAGIRTEYLELIEAARTEHGLQSIWR